MVKARLTGKQSNTDGVIILQTLQCAINMHFRIISLSKNWSISSLSSCFNWLNDDVNFSHNGLQHSTTAIKPGEEHEITACMPINMLVPPLLITVEFTFKLSSGAKRVSVALYEAYITERRRGVWRINEELRAKRERIQRLLLKSSMEICLESSGCKFI